MRSAVAQSWICTQRNCQLLQTPDGPSTLVSAQAIYHLRLDTDTGEAPQQQTYPPPQQSTPSQQAPTYFPPPPQSPPSNSTYYPPPPNAGAGHTPRKSFNHPNIAAVQASNSVPASAPPTRTTFGFQDGPSPTPPPANGNVGSREVDYSQMPMSPGPMDVNKTSNMPGGAPSAAHFVGA